MSRRGIFPRIGCEQALRTPRTGPALHLAVLGMLLCSGAALAHEYWLMPSDYFPAPSDTVCITAWVGTGFQGEERKWSPDRCVDFRLLGTTSRSLSTHVAQKDSSWACVTLPNQDGAVIAYTSTFAFIEMAGDEFDSYLALEGLDAPRRTLKAAQGTPELQRERYRRCLKTWIRGRGGSAYATVARQPLELIPLTDPTIDRPTTFRLEFGGHRLPGALVRAWHRPLSAGGHGFSPAARDSLPPATEGRTDARGEIELHLAGSGEYLISAVHMIECGDRDVADWESNWASFTFARKGAGKP